jgi:hypothetical protein
MLNTTALAGLTTNQLNSNMFVVNPPLQRSFGETGAARHVLKTNIASVTLCLCAFVPLCQESL